MRMVCTKQRVTRHYVEEDPVEEESSSGEEMEAPPEVESCGESMAEDTAAEEEASRHHGRKAPEGWVSFKNSFVIIN